MAQHQSAAIQVSCWTKVKTGAMMGAALGCGVGLMFGSFVGIRGGLRGKKLINELGSTMLQSGGTFGTFLAIGSAIRC
ncbi:reactive oxygen species modulator 1-like [Bolinopsis microptera]|uniref:reactive oxygen species modulator 1-like n=1 Tax=Bolinopsis microptera TaxID=2820187 RepID=UPI00307AA64D